MSKNEKYLQILILALLSIVLLEFYLLQIKYSSSKSFNKSSQYPEVSSINTQYSTHNDNTNLFRQIALKHGTDKVTTHHYEYVYGQLVGPIRNEKLNFLEIGLGCGMPYGPGKSIPVWKEFMPNANISVLEFNEVCARSFQNKVTHLYVGDQSDLNLMKRIGEMSGGVLDLVVDDGGHTRKQQINSLIGLWPFIRKNGGIYIIEDIFTSFLHSFNDNSQQSSLDIIIELIVILNNPTMAGFTPPYLYPASVVISEQALIISKELASVNCFERACALIKK